MVDTTPTPDYDYGLIPDHLWIEDDQPIGPNDPLVVTSLRLLYVSAYSVALLGLPLNLAVIAAALFGRRKKKRPPAGQAQILGLAATHLARCLFLPLSLLSALRRFSWESGAAACKLASYVTFVDMFSAVLIVTFWHAARCVPKKCLPGNMLFPVLLSWFLGAVLAVPSLLSMELQENPARNGTVFCAESYDYVTKRSPSAVAVERTTAVAVSRVLFGLAFPVVVIVASRSVKCGGRNDVVETPPERESPVLWPVTFGHFICWAPVLLLSLLQVTAGEAFSSTYGLPLCTVLHVFNGVVCPLLCLWKDKECLSLLCLWKGKEEVDNTRTSSTNKDEHDTVL